MRLLGIELALVALADEVDGVNSSGWLVETLSESVSNMGPWCYVVAASP
jgi:hypothetical protein